MSKFFDRKVVMQRTKAVCPGALDFMPQESLTKALKYDDQLDFFSFGHLTVYFDKSRGTSCRKNLELNRFRKYRDKLDEIAEQV